VKIQSFQCSELACLTLMFGGGDLSEKIVTNVS